MRIRFGDSVLDTETRVLSRAAAPVHLSPKAYDLLRLLLEKRPKAVSKAEVHENLWPGTFVSDGTLTSLVAEVRSAIGDGDAAQIRTVHRFGYAFSGPAETAPEKKTAPQRFAYRLLGRHGREIALSEGESIIGRDPDATAFIDDASVSRRHARIRITDGEAVIEDLQSKNGTSVGGEKIASSRALRDGDLIGFGFVDLTYRVFPLSGSTETAGSRARPRRQKADRE
jgi:DNA-binding winged helix-turn-helix (wHTH) protein